MLHKSENKDFSLFNFISILHYNIQLLFSQWRSDGNKSVAPITYAPYCSKDGLIN